MKQILFLALCAALAGASSDDVREWRRQREAQLKADDGWLTVAGLFWLKEGPNPFGADPSSDIVLPPGSAPASAGAFEFHQGKTTLRAAPGAGVTVNDHPAAILELRPDADRVAIRDLTMQVIQRAGRYAIRLRDKNSKVRKEFPGLRWLPIRDEYRVTAKFVPYNPPKMLSIPTILGDVEKIPSPGYAVFTLKGREYRLDPVAESPTELFFIFRDLTAGNETYPAGRFLDAEMPAGDSLVLDFNQAYNPPCAFTPYATCPLPPKHNWLAIRVEAGEKSVAGGHGGS